MINVESYVCACCGMGNYPNYPKRMVSTTFWEQFSGSKMVKYNGYLYPENHFSFSLFLWKFLKIPQVLPDKYGNSSYRPSGS